MNFKAYLVMFFGGLLITVGVLSRDVVMAAIGVIIFAASAILFLNGSKWKR